MLRIFIFILFLINITATLYSENNNKLKTDFITILKYARISELAKLSDEVIKQNFDNVEIFTFSKGKYRFFLATDDIHKQQIISIRGTENFSNVITDFAAAYFKSRKLGIKVHAGFYRIYLKVYKLVKPKLKKDYSIVLTGHSLGGALSVILGMSLQIDGYKITKIITYGQPKITNCKGAELYRNRLPLTRVINNNDVITMLAPYKPFKYCHIGKAIILLDGKKYTILDKMILNEDESISTLWNDLFNGNVSIGVHHIANYIKNISKKGLLGEYVEPKNSGLFEK